MWWILLTVTVNGLTADSVYRTESECLQEAELYAAARCVAVEIRLPEGTVVE
jgi:hypothetical protein